MDAGRLSRALRAWRRVVGARHVVTENGALRSAETATFHTSQRIPAILRPRGRAQVQACLRIASRHRVPVHPVSCGKNWGYGSRVPLRDGSVLLDLGRMDRILAFDERLGTVTLEPGVTFRKLHGFLRARRSRLRANPTGSTPDSSPLANALERGLGLGPLGDRFATVCGFDAVLPTGALVRTGFARLPRAAAATLHRWGVGPYVDGLFSQSNLGVVTRATLWLTPIPDHFDRLTATVARPAGLAAMIDALQPLLLKGAIRNALEIANDYRTLSTMTQYPWSVAGTRTPLPRGLVRRLVPRPSPWAVRITLEYPTPRHRAPMRRLLRDALGRACESVSFRSEAEMEAAEREEMHRPTSDSGIVAAYWRKRGRPPRRMDPDRDSCGEIWCCPVVPLEGRHVARAARIVERTATDAGFEPMMAICVLDGRTAHIIAPLFFDRSVPGEDARALACARTMHAALGREGYYPYRLGVNSMPLLPPARNDDAAFRSALKRALDPSGVLSPGRYEA